MTSTSAAAAAPGEGHDMGMPSGIGIIDTMMGFPHHDMKSVYKFITAQTRDVESKEEFEFPVEYMFKDVPEKGFERHRRPDQRDPARDGPLGHREGDDHRGRRYPARAPRR